VPCDHLCCQHPPQLLPLLLLELLPCFPSTYCYPEGYAQRLDCLRSQDQELSDRRSLPPSLELIKNVCSSASGISRRGQTIGVDQVYTIGVGCSCWSVRPYSTFPICAYCRPVTGTVPNCSTYYICDGVFSHSTVGMT
jgi:hypothetical protein